MKARFFLLLAATVIFAACETPYRATDSALVVSPEMRTNFETQYPGATRVVWSSYDPAGMSPVDWELAEWPTLDSADYVVTFDLDNNNYYAWYDSEGNWIGSSYMMSDFSQLPQVVSTTIKDKYPGYTITSVNREFQKDRLAYEVELIKDDSRVKALIDANSGLVVKSKEKTK